MEYDTFQNVANASSSGPAKITTHDLFEQKPDDMPTTTNSPSTSKPSTPKEEWPPHPLLILLQLLVFLHPRYRKALAGVHPLLS